MDDQDLAGRVRIEAVRHCGFRQHPFGARRPHTSRSVRGCVVRRTGQPVVQPSDPRNSPAGAALDRRRPARVPGHRPHRQRLAPAPRGDPRAAGRSQGGEAVATVSRHLLANYAALMPANPRLVKRVANCFGMLKALRDATRHTEELDTIVRAAVMFVRFPALVDELLSAADPPVTGLSEIGASNSVWGRRDVQQVLGHVDIEAIARCFGREFPLAPITMIVLPNGPAERRPSTRTLLQPAEPSGLSP